MNDQINKLEISDMDKMKAIAIIKENRYGCEYLEDLLNICFLIIPSFHDKLNEKYKESKIYQELIRYDNLKRSIAFKIMLDKIAMEDSDFTPRILSKMLTSLCNYKMVNMKVSIDKYKLYASTIESVNTKAIGWVEYILTSDSILKLSDKDYEKIIYEVKIITANNKDGESVFDDNGDWDIRKSDYKQIKAYKKVLDKK